MAATRLLRISCVCERVGLSRSSIYKLISENSFPAPVQLGARSVAWEERRVEIWVQGRLKAPRRLNCTSTDGAVRA